ncbi:hypothetical protein [Burkholderia seminalis]|nr:hypothetical protein [Burkholderia seminalis]
MDPDGLRGGVPNAFRESDSGRSGSNQDYVYEIKSYGGFDNMFNRTLTLNFTTDVVPGPNPPVIEMANVSGGVVTYKPTIMGSIYSNRPNYSLAAAPNFTGLYVVRLRP